jgi:hypothetical protein
VRIVHPTTITGSRRWRPLLLGALIAATLSSAAGAQVERPASLLGASLPSAASVASTGDLTTLQVRWQVGNGAADALVRPADLVPVNTFAIAGRAAVRGPLVRERDPQWSEDEIVVVAIDAAGRETSWQKVRDPRVLRSEQPGPTGELQGETFYRVETELVVVVPDASTTALRVYEIRWDGAQSVLRPLGQFEVTAP